jgi:hypothetical protein
VTIGVYLLIHPTAGVFIDFKGVTRGISYGRKKSKTKQEKQHKE